MIAARRTSKCKIKVARIEAIGQHAQERHVCVTFQIDRRPISFQVPLLLRLDDFEIRKWFKQQEMRSIGYSLNFRRQVRNGS